MQITMSMFLLFNVFLFDGGFSHFCCEQLLATLANMHDISTSPCFLRRQRQVAVLMKIFVIGIEKRKFNDVGH